MQQGITNVGADKDEIQVFFDEIQISLKQIGRILIKTEVIMQ